MLIKERLFVMGPCHVKKKLYEIADIRVGGTPQKIAQIIGIVIYIVLRFLISMENILRHTMKP